jgi:hypothetical protein
MTVIENTLHIITEFKIRLDKMLLDEMPTDEKSYLLFNKAFILLSVILIDSTTELKPK